eukprot:SAG31_NODE_6027_length_2203_cov_1.693441_1_plen_30_part_10
MLKRVLALKQKSEDDEANEASEKIATSDEP